MIYWRQSVDIDNVGVGVGDIETVDDRDGVWDGVNEFENDFDHVLVM